MQELEKDKYSMHDNKKFHASVARTESIISNEK